GRGPGRVPPGLPHPGPLRGAQQPQDLDLSDRGEPVPQPPPVLAASQEGLLPAPRRADAGRPGPARGGGSRAAQPVRRGAAAGALRARPGRPAEPRLRPPRDPAAARGRGALVRDDRRHPGHPGGNGEEPARPRARSPARAAPGLPGRGGSGMTCTRVRAQLSSYLDGDLSPAASGALSAHLETCPSCARHLESLRAALGMLADLPRISPSEGIAARVFDRLEVETRGPGLAMVFRSFGARRPLIFPSLVTAGLLVVTVLLGSVALDRAWRSLDEPLPPVAGAWGATTPASGTEANPLFPSADVGLPRARPGGPVAQDILAQMGEGTL